MTLDLIDNKALSVSQYDVTDKLSSMNASFDSKIVPVEGQFLRFDASVDSNVRQWLKLDSAADVTNLHDSLMDSIKQMYYGTEVDGKRTLGLQEIHNWKREGVYKEMNTKQQAGFAAEVISTTKENLIAKHEGTGITTYRADDLPELFPKNDQYVDKVRMDANGNIVERVQTKFVGNDGASCLSKLMGKKFDKYVFDGKVDKIEIPQDFLKEIRENNLIEAKRQSLEQQLARVSADGNTDVAQKIELKLDKLNRLDEMLEGSTCTMAEAIDGVKHPTRTTSKLFAKEVLPAANDAGIKSGLAAAGITLAVSIVDNISDFIDGEITAEEMVTDIVKETATAGAVEYGSEFVSATVSQAMSKSSSALVKKVAGSSMPVAVVSFAVESYDSVSAYAKGEIDGEELAYELGENAASVTGAMKGASIGAAIGSVAGPAGTIAGGLVGGVVGAAVASEVYATAVELGADGIDKLAEHVESLMKDTIELVEHNIPEKAAEVKLAFSEYIDEFKLPFCL